MGKSSAANTLKCVLSVGTRDIRSVLATVGGSTGACTTAISRPYNYNGVVCVVDSYGINRRNYNTRDLKVYSFSILCKVNELRTELHHWRLGTQEWKWEKVGKYMGISIG